MIASSSPPPSPTFSCRGSISPSLPRNRKRKRKREGIKLRVEMRRSRPRDLWKEQEFANFSRIGTFRLRPKHWSDDRIGTFYNWHVGESRASVRPLTHTLTKKEGRIILMGPFSPFPFSLDEKEGGSRVEGEIYVQRTTTAGLFSALWKSCSCSPLLLSLRGRSRASGRCHVKLC